MKDSRPKFITLEGIEGVGKSTHIKTICNFLDKKNIDYIKTHEPGKTKIGERIRDLLLEETDPPMQATTEILLLCANRTEHLAQIVMPALAQGKWVVSDRFFDSSIAYQGGGRGLPMPFVKHLKEYICAEVSPDLTFLFCTERTISKQRLAHREHSDRIESESDMFFDKVQKTYLELVQQEPERWRVVDTSAGNIEQDAQKIHTILEKFLVIDND